MSWMRGSPGEVRNPLFLRGSGIEVSDSSPARRGTSADDSFSEDRDIELRVKFLRINRSLGRGVEMLEAATGIIIVLASVPACWEESVLNTIGAGLKGCVGWQV